MSELKSYSEKNTTIPAAAQVSCLSINVADNGGMIINYDLKVPNKMTGGDPYADKYSYEYRKEVFTTYEEMTARLMELCKMMGVAVKGLDSEESAEEAEEME